MKIGNDEFELLVSQNAINKEVMGTITSIDKYIESVGVENVVFVVMMNGGDWFANKIFDHYKYTPLHIEYMSVSSYNGEVRSGLKFNTFPSAESIKDKHIVILEDIVDSGETMRQVNMWFESQNIKSIHLCILCKREGTGYTGNIYVDNTLNTPLIIEKDKWIVGCGMDHHHVGRNLSEIWAKI